MRSRTLGVLLLGAILLPAQVIDLNAKVARLTVGVSTFEELLGVFGEPNSYLWGQQTFTRDNLPATFLAYYPGGFSALVSGRKVVELRFTQPGFIYLEKLQVGSPLEDVLKMAAPYYVVQGEAMPAMPIDGVLYQDIGGSAGYCYYSRPELGARFSFRDGKISVLFLVPKREIKEPVPRFNPNSTDPFQVDLRGRNLAALDLRDRLDDLLNASFDDKTVWPPADKRPAGFDPWQILALGRLAGLGVRDLHQQGITGRGVGIAILDSPLVRDHQEFGDRLRWYEDLNLEGQTQPHMHGNAIASIAAGRNCGVAPDAEIYYIATWIAGTGSDGKDFTNLARGVRRILEINSKLPDDRKIRVISASVGWSPSEKAYADVSAAAAEAKAAGLLFVSSSIEQVHGFKFQALGRAPMADPDQFESYEPGMFWAKSFFAGARFTDRLLVPMDARTTASPTGPKDYVFYRHGGWSWAIPYIAGLYALAAQVDPAITPERFWPLAMKTGRTIKLKYKDEEIPFGPIADPAALIAQLKP